MEKKMLYPIIKSNTMDIKTAKEFYMSMGCSHFHMARENPKDYQGYLELEVDQETEQKWKEENVNHLIKKITIGEFKNPDLWHPHSRLCDLIEKMDTRASHIKLLEITKYIYNYLPANMRVIISENLNGRTEIRHKRGLIFNAYKSGYIEIAKEYIKYSRMYSEYIEGTGMDYKRCHYSQKKCEEIRKMLNL